MTPLDARTLPPHHRAAVRRAQTEWLDATRLEQLHPHITRPDGVACTTATAQVVNDLSCAAVAAIHGSPLVPSCYVLRRYVRNVLWGMEASIGRATGATDRKRLTQLHSKATITLRMLGGAPTTQEAA